MKYQQQCQDLMKKMGDHYHDHQHILPMLFAAYFMKGHVLIEGPPGTGKTSLAKLISVMFNKSFGRIQCTSDLLPQDITGYSVLRGDTLDFVQGPVFSNFLLVDELNRASPRAQSALLEAMEERQVSIDGTTHTLSEDFFVIATQNPQDHEGTFPLPEVQLDRFLICLNTHHASATVDHALLMQFMNKSLPIAFAEIDTVSLNHQEISEEMKSIHVDESLVKYIADVLHKTRTHELIAYGASLRAGLALLRCAQGLAYMQGRDMVTPDDIKHLAKPVLNHRISLSSQAIFQQQSKDQCIDTLLMELPFPS